MNVDFSIRVLLDSLVYGAGDRRGQGGCRFLRGRSSLARPGPSNGFVQQLGTEGFAVSFAVGQLATGWVEWGLSSEQLDQRAVASRAGLVQASDSALIMPISLGDRGTSGRRIY